MANIFEPIFVGSGGLSAQFLKTIAFGDSFTDQGDDPRQISGLYGYRSDGWWCWANILTTNHYNMLDGAGVHGNRVINLLERMNDVLLSGADVVLVLCGTNDMNAGATPADTAGYMEQVVDAILANGQKVLLNYVTHRNIAEGLNANIDQLNALYEGIAASRSGCEISAPFTEFDDFVDAGNHLEVTTDGLHPNPYGAYLLGKVTAQALNQHFPSEYAALVNEAVNPSFSGSGGSLESGATGAVPDNWKLYFAEPTDGGVNPAEGVGGVITVDNGTNVLTVKTGTTLASNYGKGYLWSDDMPVDSNSVYAFDCELDIDDLSNISIFRVDLYPSTGNFQRFTFTVPQNVALGVNNMFVRTTGVDVGASTTVQLRISGETLEGNRFSFSVKNPRLYKLP